MVSSAIVDKYIGESARLIREMFGYAKEHEPCIIFMDEIDAIGGRRFSEGTSADREIQRTLMELLNQLDGFDYLGKTKIIMATNRPDTLDPALLRAGRLDRKIEIPLPNEVGRLEILKIHASTVVTEGEIDFESIVKMSDGLNGADLRNVVTEAYVSISPFSFDQGLTLTIETVVSSRSKMNVTRSTKMTLTRQFARWLKQRNWRVNWSTRNYRAEAIPACFCWCINGCMYIKKLLAIYHCIHCHYYLLVIRTYFVDTTNQRGSARCRASPLRNYLSLRPASMRSRKTIQKPTSTLEISASLFSNVPR